MSRANTLGRSAVASPHWLAALLVVFGTVVFAYRDTLASMVSIWSRSDTFAHSFLVPPIVLWLVWRKRDALAAVPRQPCAWMLLPMAALAFVWLLGDLASVNSVTQLAMTGMLVLAVPTILGLRVARVISFPLAFLFFAVPIGEFLLPQLMSWTADFTVLALRVTGIPVFREGSQIVIPSGTWSVVEACSGVRYLLASFMVGTLFAYLNYQSTRRRWIFVGVSVVVPVLANWVRAYLIVLLAHLTDNRLAVGVDHLVYGWLFFGVVMALMFVIGASWVEPRGSSRTSTTSRATASGRELSARGSVWSTALSASMVVLVPSLVSHVMADSRTPSPPPQLSGLKALPHAQTSGSGSAVIWKPAFQQPSAEMSANYSVQGRDIGMYIGYYRQQNYRRKLVSSENELVKSLDPVWVELGTSSEGIEIGGDPITFRTALIRRAPAPAMPEQRLLVWHIYWVGDRLTSSAFRAKAYAALDRLLHHRDDAAVIVLYTSENQRDGARGVLDSFARANLRHIIDRLRATRDGVVASGEASGLRNRLVSTSE